MKRPRCVRCGYALVRYGGNPNWYAPWRQSKERFTFTPFAFCDPIGVTDNVRHSPEPSLVTYIREQ